MYTAVDTDMKTASVRELRSLTAELIDSAVAASGRTLPKDWFVAWGVIVFAGLGALFVFLYNHFRGKHRASGRPGKEGRLAPPRGEIRAGDHTLTENSSESGTTDGA